MKYILLLPPLLVGIIWIGTHFCWVIGYTPFFAFALQDGKFEIAKDDAALVLSGPTLSSGFDIGRHSEYKPIFGYFGTYEPYYNAAGTLGFEQVHCPPPSITSTIIGDLSFGKKNPFGKLNLALPFWLLFGISLIPIMALFVAKKTAFSK